MASLWEEPRPDLQKSPPHVPPELILSALSPWGPGAQRVVVPEWSQGSSTGPRPFPEQGGKMSVAGGVLPWGAEPLWPAHGEGGL